MSRLTADRLVRVRGTALDEIASHARTDQPHECCGLLIGTGDLIVEAVATPNVAADPIRRFEIPPVEHIRQMRRCRTFSAATGRPRDVVGAYHSHPRSAPAPSSTDLEQAFGEFVYLIAGPVVDACDVEIRAYRLEGGVFESITIERC